MSWPTYKLTDLCNKITDGSHNPPPGISESKFLMLSSKNIFDDDINFHNPRYLTKDDFERENRRTDVSSGDVLLTIVGTVGRAAVVPDGSPKFTLQRSVAVLKPKHGIITSRFLMYTLRSMLDVLLAGARGVAQQGIYLKQLHDLDIKVPSVEIQKHIVNVLDKASSLCRKREQGIKLADEFLRATFSNMFGNPDNNIKNFPIGTIRDLVSSASYGLSSKTSKHSGKYPVLRMGNITYQGDWDLIDLKYIDLDEKAQEKFLLEKGDLLFNRTNSKELVGKTAIFENDRDMAFAGYLIRVRTNEIGNNYYIAGYLNSLHGKNTLINMSKSIVGMANINAQEMQNIKILIPPKELQDNYEKIYKTVKNKIKIHIESKKESEMLFNNLSDGFFN
ncbi:MULTISPECIES: restriction endonuclease subunit S [Pectobacterium]|uniref:Restriction modification system DNA specificity domain protein n=1 Tax=Pectobacterium carotovorum subsp. carotovorum (strain PC1) TaxID=561230 RepID=C6DAR8_PECCP|nr:restriction endonuclease subunit S [Pectobacterium carotovorum]ACT13902.1 restriction modification system DNA specificity domain protein [Pectobacterium carotovorum subsp. carotovorum PC1]